MPNISSKEVDVEMSDNESESSGDYGGGHDLEEDSVSYSLGSSKTSSVEDDHFQSSNSFYKNARPRLPKNVALDFFDPNEMTNQFVNVGFTGDQVRSDNSSRTCVESQYVFGHSVKLKQLQKEIVANSKLAGRDMKLFNKTFFKSVSNSLEGSDMLTNKKPIITKKSITHTKNNTLKVPNAKDPVKKDSITLFIKVPRGKLLNHFKDKSKTESKRNLTFKSPSSLNSSDSSDSQINSNTIRLNDESNDSSNQNKDSAVNSMSNITSYIDKSKKFIRSFRDSMKMTDKKLQTNNIYQSIYVEKLEKETQTMVNSINTRHPNENYFLCNICHKIVPADLPPVCMKLKCSAKAKCDLIFHSELDMIMHLPVKHTSEFESYKICIKCNLMYHPSNTVSIKGRCTCLDCLASLVQIANG